MRRRIDPAAMPQRVEGGQSWPGAQLRVPAASNQLLGLDKEFDLADTAATQLDVMPLDGNLLMPAIGMNLPFHGMHIRNGREIQILAPYERRQVDEKPLGCLKVARARAGLDQRRAFPILTPALVVIERGRRGYGDLSGRRIRPQPQIDAKHVTVSCALLQQFCQIPGQAYIQGSGLRPCNDRSGIIKNDEIDIARIVELVGPHFAHGKHDVARPRWIRRFRQLELAAYARIHQQVAHRRVDRRVRQSGLSVDEVRDGPHLPEIGQRNQ